MIRHHIHGTTVATNTITVVSTPTMSPLPRSGGSALKSQKEISK
jgi:hypothetical protein